MINQRPATVLEGERSIRGRQSCGLDGGAWCGEGETSDDPDDQRADDGMSLTFDSAPLDPDLHVLGFPRAVLELRSDRPVALIAVLSTGMWGFVIRVLGDPARRMAETAPAKATNETI